jgi:addiction module HigA family antidote
MNITKRKPVSVGEMLTEEFMQPIGLTQVELAKLMGVSRKTVNELCTNRRSVTAETALMLAGVLGNTPDFWLNAQQRNDLWKVLHTKRQAGRIQKAEPLPASRRHAAR